MIDELMKEIYVPESFILTHLVNIVQGKEKTADKLKALELLGRNKAMFTDKVQQTGATEIVVGLPKKEEPKQIIDVKEDDQEENTIQ
jgi:hypothetical protein